MVGHGNIIPYSGSVPPHPYSPYCNCLNCVTWARQQSAMLQQQAMQQQQYECLLASPYSSPIVANSNPPIESSPPIISDLITYRCWNINRHGLLTSVYMPNVVWLPHQPFEAPDINNTSTGIHSFKSLSDAYSYPAEVVGAVQIWGEVIEHEKGYRSRFAKINSIISVNKDLHFNIRNWNANRKILKYLQDTYLN